MFSEKVHNWAKIFELFTDAMKAIAIGIIPETGALQPTLAAGKKLQDISTTVS